MEELDGRDDKAKVNEGVWGKELKSRIKNERQMLDSRFCCERPRYVRLSECTSRLFCVSIFVTFFDVLLLINLILFFFS